MAPTELIQQRPQAVLSISPNLTLFDFGKVAFGNVEIVSTVTTTLLIRFGEKLAHHRIDGDPPGTIRYQQVVVIVRAHVPTVVAPPPNGRNTEQISDTHPPAVLTPPQYGVLMPFRYLEIQGQGIVPSSASIAVVRRAVFLRNWDDNASHLETSNVTLNRIWDLCKYSIKATTFAGIYVDGDRERISYEADAHLNQMSHYMVEPNAVSIVRDTFERLCVYPTWPTEWSLYMIFIAYADYMHTGNVNWLSNQYGILKTKLLEDRVVVGTLGLIASNDEQQLLDLVDWPQTERDEYVFTELNTVVNAFYLEALREMETLADVLDKQTDRKRFLSQRIVAKENFQKLFFDANQGLYRDGVNTDHCSLHANLFSLAFGLVPEPSCPRIVNWLTSRGMRCSVYAAQYLLSGLFENGAETAALNLILSNTDRSWKHMVDSGTTITWEAWDLKYKPNQDWNHAWGAAPANLLPKYILGVQVEQAGWEMALIRPCPGDLSRASGKVPTPRGAICISWTKTITSFRITITMPEKMTARVDLPAITHSSIVLVNGKPVAATRKGPRWILTDAFSGTAEIEVVSKRRTRLFVAMLTLMISCSFLWLFPRLGRSGSGQIE